MSQKLFRLSKPPGSASPKSLSDAMPVRLTAGGVSASIVRIIETGGEYQMDIQLATDPLTVDWNALLFSIRAGGMRRLRFLRRELTLISAQCEGGGPTNNLRCLWSNRSAVSTRTTAQPYRLTWQIPARTVRLAIPFELDNVVMK